MDTAREQCPEVILEPTVLHCYRQGLTIQILLEREQRHVQRVPSWISQLQGNVLVPLSVQEVLQSNRSRGRQQSVQRDGREQTGKHHPEDAAASHNYFDLRE